MTQHILFVDDDADIQTAARLLLTRRGFSITPARTPAEAMTALACETIDAVLLDLNYAPGATTGAEGLALLRDMLGADPSLPVVVVTGHSGVAIAVSAMRAGAADFVMKPWNNERLMTVLTEALQRGPRVIAPPRAFDDARMPETVMIGTSPAMVHAFTTADRIAPAAVNVLLTGPAGTGKTALSRRIHRLSGANAPLGTLHAAAFDPQALEADARIWLLRDVDALDATAQHAIADRLDRPDAPRLIATSRLDAAELQARLTPTLYYRLATIQIALPPLAARPDDIADLARHYLRFYGKRHDRSAPELTADTIMRLQNRPWPQNLHELLTAMERAVLLGIDAAFGAYPAPSDAVDAAARAATLAHSERAMIEQALKRHGFNVSHAARELGLTRPALYRRMARYGF